MAELGAVPMTATASLAELLVATRTDAGVELGELSRLSGLDVERIEAVECGRHDLDDAELAELLDRYRIPPPSRRFARAAIEIDLDAGSLRLRRSRRPRSIPAADRNLLQYLSLVHRHFELEPGTDIPLKAVDLNLLRASLALRRTEVASRLDRMGQTVGPSLRDRSLLAVAIGTGLVVAAGAIVLIPDRTTSEPSPGPAIDPRIDIGTPLVIERDPSEIPDPLEVPDPTIAPSLGEGPTDPGMADAGPGDRVEPDARGTAGDAAVEAATDALAAPRIGRPLVLERPAPTEVPTPPDAGDNRPRGPPDATD